MDKPKKFIIKVLGRSGVVREYVTVVDKADAHFLRSYFWTVQNATPSYERVKNGEARLYVNRNIGKGICEYLHHRIIDAKPKETVWHINGDTLDNRRSNLLKSSDRVVEIE